MIARRASCPRVVARRLLVLTVLVPAALVLTTVGVPVPSGGVGQAVAAPSRSDAAPPDGVLVDRSSGKRVVALTFDDGPDPAWTPQVLALLREHGAKATFCMVGQNVRAHPDLVRAVVKAGHRLCDHTRTHPKDLRTLAVDAQHAEIVSGRSDLASVVKSKVRYFRAPGGNWSPEIVEFADDEKMRSIGWSVDPRDWSRPGPAAIVATVQARMHPGAIVLMHDGGGDRSQTVAALGTLLTWLDEQDYGYGFPT